MIGHSGIGPLATRQLAAWQELAATWPLRAGRTGSHLVCAGCDASVLPLVDGGDLPYAVTVQMITDATVMHLRRRHADMEPGGL